MKKLTEKVKHQYDLFHHPVREFGEFYYKAGSWTLAERVVVKVEITRIEIRLDYAKHHPMKRELRHVLQFYEQKKVS